MGRKNGVLGGFKGKIRRRIGLIQWEGIFIGSVGAYKDASETVALVCDGGAVVALEKL